MQVMITHGSVARTRVLHFSRWQLAAALVLLLLVLTALSGTIYHVVFQKAVREGWPVVSQLVRLIVRDEFAQRDRFLRENLDAIADRVGAIQAKLVKLEAMGDRVTSLVGVRADELPAAPARAASAAGGGRGGPYVPAESMSVEQLVALLDWLDATADHRSDQFTLVESRLLEKKFAALLVPSTRPVDGPVGSGFGFRLDPFTGRSALHTGLDFPAEPGTTVVAAAGGMVTATDWHPAYGHTVEIDHGRGLVTRYAHNSKVVVAAGDLVKRGQTIAAVGSSGRSTGPHLHFEVLVEGVPQNPERFLAAAGGAPLRTAAASAATPAAARR